MTFGLLLVYLVLIGIGLFIGILYLKTLRDTLREIDSMHRTVEPDNVWLMLIPLFNFVYAFMLYPKISESIERHYASQNIYDEDDYGKGLGLGMAVLNLVALVPVIGGLASLANLIIWIIYWKKMVTIKHNLKMSTVIANAKDINLNKDILDS